MTRLASSAECISRFRVLRPLGQGAQGVVYAAYDPELDRQVAIKTLLLNEVPDPRQVEQFVAAARTASSLSHPNIVPVFEVGVHEGRPFVVFELVEGRTLADTLEADGALPMARAVVMMSQILAGMAHVHASGLLHGDIKPANILIGANGIPRVTDFGIARNVLAAAQESVAAGTVQYSAPESLSDGRADYRSDVFALGLLFHEMLTGRPVFEAPNEYSVIYRILNEMPAPPSAHNPRIDCRLDDIVMKALQRDPARRYADAREMKLDLDRFRVPVDAGAAQELKELSLHSTVEFLLRRMAVKSDFPALSASFNRINRIAGQDEEASIKAVSNLVMRDFALSQRLLRIANSSAVGTGRITRVSQAITLLGFAQLRAIATGMMLAATAGGARKGAIAEALTDAFVAAVIARNVGRVLGMQSVEELFICGMFSRLGEILTLHYLGEEHDAIVARMTEERMDAATASRVVLGLTFDQLGTEVARHWKFPEVIVHAMSPLPAGTIEPATGEAERMRLCAGYARELCTLVRTTGGSERERAFAAHQQRFAAAIPVNTAQVRLLIGHSVNAALQYVAASGLELVQTALIDGMRVLAVTEGASAQSPAAATAGSAESGEPLAAATTRDDPHTAAAPEQASADAAAAGAASGDQARPPESGATGMGSRLVRAWRALFST